MYLVVVSVNHFCNFGEILDYQVPVYGTNDPTIASNLANDLNKEIEEVNAKMALWESGATESVGTKMLTSLNKRLGISEYMREGYVFHAYSGECYAEDSELSTSSRFSVREIPTF